MERGQRTDRLRVMFLRGEAIAVIAGAHQRTKCLPFRNEGQEGGGRRRTLVTSLPAARMRAIAGAVASTATAM